MVPASAPAAVVDAAPPSRAACLEPRFSVELPIAEASGAVYLAADAAGPARVLVVGDSGNGGPFVEMAAADGAVIARGTMPLDPGASDDLEGLDRVGDRFYAITSSGYMRAWERAGDGFRLVDPAYPVAEPGHGRPPLSCDDGGEVNCGSNFEGLCLHDPPPAAGCAGYAVAKRTGRLVCLRWAGPRLAATRADGIEVAGPGTLSGCAFAPGSGRLLVGSNMFGGNAVYEVAPGSSPRLVGRLGPGFGEAIAAGPTGDIYRFSDTGAAPSASKKFVCP